MSEVAVQTIDLEKVYRGADREVRATDGLSLEVRAGEVFGLLGPNGAGKTTTVGMLTTRVRPTGGEAWVSGIDVVRDPVGVKRKIGVVTQHNTLDRQLTVAENLEFRGRYCLMPVKEARARAAELLEMFGLTERSNAVVHKLSGGQAQRVLIARALVHRPAVLFLDEPTSGLDPQTRVNLWDVLRAMRVDGQTIVLTTHYLEEAEGLCDRIGIVDHGKMLACGTLDGLTHLAGSETVLSLLLDDDVPASLIEIALGLPGVSAAEVADGPAEVVAHGSGADGAGTMLKVYAERAEAILDQLIRAAVDAGRSIRDIQLLRPSLESVFLTLTGREYRE